MAERPLTPTLYGGYPGVGWMVKHLQGRLLSTGEGEDPGEELDEELARYLDRPDWQGEYDLILRLAFRI